MERRPALPDRLFIASFSCWLVSLPFSKAAVSIFLVVLLLLSVWRYVIRPVQMELKDFGLFFCISGLFWVYAFSLLWSADVDSGIVFLKSQLPLIAVPLVLVLNKDMLHTHARRWVNLFLLAIMLAWLATWLINLLPHEWLKQVTTTERVFQPYSQSDRQLFGMYSPFITRIQLSNFLAFGILFSLYGAAVYKKTYYFFALLWCLFGMVMLGGRGGQIGLFASVAVLGVMFSAYQGRLLHQKITRGVLSLLILIAAGYMMVFHMEPIKSRYAQLMYENDLLRTGKYKEADYTHFTSLRRYVSWENSRSLIYKAPFFGTGIGDYKQAYQQAYQQDKFDLPVNNHSQYLHVAGATGAAGLMLWVSCLFGWLYLHRDTPFYPNRMLAISCLVFLVVAMIPDALLLKQVDNVLFSFILSWWAWGKR